MSKPEITNGLDPIHVYVENSESFTPDDRSKIAVKVVNPDGTDVTSPQLRPSSASASSIVVPKISTPDRIQGK